MVDLATVVVTVVTAPVSVALVNGLFNRVKKYKEAPATKGKPLFVNGERDEIIIRLDELREGHMDMSRRLGRVEARSATNDRRLQDVESVVQSSFSVENKLNEILRRMSSYEERLRALEERG